jgi:hypothetical protein
LGAACWLARSDRQSRAAKGLIVAISLYNVAAVGVLAFAGIGLGLRGVALWPAVILHTMMTVWCFEALRRESLNVTTEQQL